MDDDDHPEEIPFAEVRVGTEFRTDTGRWFATDKGTRTVVAISLEEPFHFVRHDDGRGASETLTLGLAEAIRRGWFAGPPYAGAEHVFASEETRFLCPLDVVSET